MSARIVSMTVLLALVSALPSSAAPGPGRVAFGVTDAVYVANPDGSGVRALWTSGCRPPGEPESPCSFPSAPSWSPDASRLAFAHGSRLIVAAADGSEAHVVATRAGARLDLTRRAWSPDGSEIALLSSEVAAGSQPRQDLWIASAGGGELRRVTFDGDHKDAPQWSPSGSELLYSTLTRTGPDHVEIFAVDTRGGPPRQITKGGPGATHDRSPSWSPDGAMIAFVRSVDAQPSKLHVVRSDGTGLRQVSPIAAEMPAWSPDGARIAFTSGANSSRVGGLWDRDLYVVGSDGSGLTRLTESSQEQIRDIDPTWSPDGSRLAFTSSNRERSETDTETAVYTMNSDGTCEGRLSPAELRRVSGESGSGAAWAPHAAPGTRRCHELAVSGSLIDERPYSAILEARLLNDGTEAVESFDVALAGGPAVTLVAAASDHGTCTKAGAGFTCSLVGLAPRARATVTFQAQVRRVTRDKGRDLLFGAEASARLSTDLDSQNNVQRLEFFVPYCTARAPGRGTVYGTQYDDHLCGRNGADRLRGFLGADRLEGGAGADVLDGGIDRDVLLGGPGADRIAARDGERDRIDCGAGRDRVAADRRDRIARNCERVLRR